jgi:hypothetical protein
MRTSVAFKGLPKTLESISGFFVISFVMRKTLKFSLALIAFFLTTFLATDINADCTSVSYRNDNGSCNRESSGLKPCMSTWWPFKDCLK